MQYTLYNTLYNIQYEDTRRSRFQIVTKFYNDIVHKYDKSAIGRNGECVISEYIHENYPFMYRMNNCATQLNSTERPVKHA